MKEFLFLGKEGGGGGLRAGRRGATVSVARSNSLLGSEVLLKRGVRMRYLSIKKRHS